MRLAPMKTFLDHLPVVRCVTTLQFVAKRIAELCSLDARTERILAEIRRT
ncbi:MAG: hypothetical protein QNI87_10600 [Erythrobacter sp.]|nr:hypothetical protein [Erythrobacter sp.]MDJ0978975.1 hypothetical protein [Erythrobacter sp.]